MYNCKIFPEYKYNMSTYYVNIFTFKSRVPSKLLTFLVVRKNEENKK